MLSLTREIKGGIFWGGWGGTSPFHTKLGGSPLGNKNLINSFYTCIWTEVPLKMGFIISTFAHFNN